MHLGHIALGDYYEQMFPLFCRQSGGMIDIVLFRKHLLFKVTLDSFGPMVSYMVGYLKTREFDDTKRLVLDYRI